MASTGEIYVANGGTTGTGSITVYAANPSGTLNEAPIATIAGGSTGISTPFGVAVDASGKIYVANRSADTITVYAANPRGLITGAPLATIEGVNTGLDMPYAIALDARGRIYVYSVGGMGSVTVYAANPRGTLNEVPLLTITGPNTPAYDIEAVAVDATGKIYLTDALGDIYVYPANLTGTVNVPPVATISGSNTGLMYDVGIALDASSNIYVTNNELGGTSGISVFGPIGNQGGSINEFPLGTVTVGLSQALFYGIALDAKGKIYVTYGATVAPGSVFVYAANPRGVASSTPIATITGSKTGLDDPGGIAIH